MGDGRGSVGDLELGSCARSAGPVPSRHQYPGEEWGGPRVQRHLLTPPFLLLSESFLASFCDQAVLQRLQQMASTMSLRLLRVLRCKPRCGASQDQLHLLRHVEPTLSSTHTPILTFPTGKLMAQLGTDGQRSQEKPSQQL